MVKKVLFSVAILASLTLCVSNVFAEAFYECVDPATGKTHFTTGALPSTGWKCKGFSMRSGGFTKIQMKTSANAPSSGGKSDRGKAKKGTMLQMWENSMKKAGAR